MFKKNDNVLVTCKVIRKGPEGAETLELESESGVVKRATTYKDTLKNTYLVATQYGVHMVNERNLVAKPS